MERKIGEDNTFQELMEWATSFERKPLSRRLQVKYDALCEKLKQDPNHPKAIEALKINAALAFDEGDEF